MTGHNEGPEGRLPVWGPAWATSTGGAGTVTSFVEGLTTTVHQGGKSLLNTTADSPRGRPGSPLQRSCLENPRDGGACP